MRQRSSLLMVFLFCVSVTLPTLLVPFLTGRVEGVSDEVIITAAERPVLEIPSKLRVETGETIDVPIYFNVKEFAIAAAIFSMDIDESCLVFDSSDDDNDGRPDNVTFSIPAAFNASVIYDENDIDGELDFFIVDSSPPLASLLSGVIVSTTLTATCVPAPNTIITAPIKFSSEPLPSLGDSQGKSVAVDIYNGSVEIWPILPATFWGTLTIDGTPAADGTEIRAIVSETEVASSTVFSRNGQFGLYTINVLGDDSNTPNVIEGGQKDQPFAFEVTGVQIAQTPVWNSGPINLALTGTTVEDPLEADFECMPRIGDIPLTILCTDQSTGNIIDWQWDFGDGYSSTKQNPTHTYELFGTYGITLSVTNPSISNTQTHSGYITVNCPPPIANAGGPYQVDEGGSISLSGFGSDPSGICSLLRFDWDLDNNGTFEVLQQDPFFDAGDIDGPNIVTVRLKVSNQFDVSSIVTTTIKVANVPPTAEAGGPYVVSIGSDITLSGSGTDPAGANDPLTFVWDLDEDGVFETMGRNPTFSTNSTNPRTITGILQVSDDDDGRTTDQTHLIVLYRVFLPLITRIHACSQCQLESTTH